MSISAMKQALEALQFFCEYGVIDRPFERIAELKQAIEEAEKQEPVGYVSESGKGAYFLVGIDLEDDTPLYTAPVHAIDISQERVDETAKDRHDWVDLTQEEVDEIYAETQDEFQFSQLLAYKLREKNFGFGSHTTKKDDNLKEMVEKGTKAWADTPADWVDELRGGAEKQEPDDDIYDIWVEQGTSQENRQVAKNATTERVQVGTRLGPSQDQVGTRIWVGLTDEERGMVVNANFGIGVWEMARAIEAKLKEKNT